MLCQNCVFFVIHNNNFMGSGQCRRYPPNPIAYVTGYGSGSLLTTDIKNKYPEVQPNGWCGEFVEKEN